MASFERVMNPGDLAHSEACSPINAMHRSTKVSAHFPPAFSWISMADWRKMQALSTAIVARTWSSQAFFKSLSPKSWAMANILNLLIKSQWSSLIFQILNLLHNLKNFRIMQHNLCRINISDELFKVFIVNVSQSYVSRGTGRRRSDSWSRNSTNFRATFWAFKMFYNSLNLSNSSTNFL